MFPQRNLNIHGEGENIQMAQPKVNYQKLLDRLILQLEKGNEVPRLLLHSCCAPCSSYVLEYLSQYFAIAVLYYNPNIAPRVEYEHRKQEQLRLIREGTWRHPVKALDCAWEPEAFSAIALGLETLPEGGLRCFRCYELRLRAAAEAARRGYRGCRKQAAKRRGGYDYFGTTLSISPLKNAQKLNEIGERLAEEYGVRHLPADFKKREGYKRSIVLSRKYGLYRQDYCGCIFSKRDREREKACGNGSE